ncbi:MAG: OmpA family protein, partial [Psychroflexus sp.]
VRQKELSKNQTSDNADSKMENDKILEKLNTQNKLIDSLIQRQSELEKRLSQNTPESKTLEKLTYSVFFGHDSHQLDAKYKSNLDKVAEFLQSESQLKVVLNAYASQTGNPEYNKKLSMLRADAVKSYLKTKDISADRILSDYHGSDASLEASSARRVEISYRK